MAWNIYNISMEEATKIPRKWKMWQDNTHIRPLFHTDYSSRYQHWAWMASSDWLDKIGKGLSGHNEWIWLRKKSLGLLPIWTLEIWKQGKRPWIERQSSDIFVGMLQVLLQHVISTNWDVIPWIFFSSLSILLHRWDGVWNLSTYSFPS